ncbi:MAG: threonine--tRNA ligase, partial [Proteobacteria bacterium]|nr:threonine--tRNA ligase [Pseudomonadota bacterium]
LRMSEFGSCHRCEPSGALHGIMRVRNFVQDDAHIFCSEEQIAPETVKFVRLLESIYQDLGFKEFIIKFSDRPALRAGSDETWDRAEQALRDACTEAGVEWTLNPGDGAFYGPKLEFILKDAIDREWQCGTWQVDFVLPERLNAEYTAADGSRLRPVMCHRAIIGSFERFIGILLEHYAGHLPLWLSPTQIVVATITDEANAYAEEVVAQLQQAGLRVVSDLRNEKINYKVRQHSEEKIPIILAIGKRESEQKTVSVRRLGSKQTSLLSLAEAISAFSGEAQAPA